MAVTPEDGTGVLGADVYDSVANTDAWVAANGANATWTAATTTAKEAAMKKATRYMDSVYDWNGIIVFPVSATLPEGQPLDWPRSAIQDGDGRVIPNNIVPTPVKVAFYLLSLEAIAGTLITAVAGNPGYVKKTKLDVLEVEYHKSDDVRESSQRDFVEADRLLIPDYASGKIDDSSNGSSKGRIGRPIERREELYRYGKDTF